MTPKLKICGMKHNVEAVAALEPDYLGFVFYDQSPRYFTGTIPEISTSIRKVGVFVNSSVEEIVNKTFEYSLDVIQLHGDEPPGFCEVLKNEFSQKAARIPKIWKVFAVADDFDFEQLHAYESLVQRFLFDTKAHEYGGSGRTFNWNLLKGYASNKPLILSGGVGPDQLPALKKFLNSGLPVHAIDLNSKFESEPGLKDITKLKAFINEL